MSTADSRTAARFRVDHDQGATFVELFFDLVFVYAVTQLTSLVLHDLHWSGVWHALLLFWLTWWAWTQFTWTLNLADTEHAHVRLTTLTATAVAFFLAQSVPDAFGDAGGWFAASYIVVRVLGMRLQHKVVGGTDARGFAVTMWIVTSSFGLVLVAIGGLVDTPARAWLWGAAVLADLLAAAVAGSGEWEIAAGHFAERHGLIVIVALGESLIAAGVATSELARDVDFALATSGAVVAACALWWSYFGVLQPRLEHRLAVQGTAHFGDFARDVYSLAHAVVVVGVIGVAVGFEQAIAHPDEHLSAAAALALTGGFALFVVGAALAAMRAKLHDAVRPRFVLAAVVLLVTPVFSAVPPAVPLWSVALAAALLAGLEHRRAVENTASGPTGPATGADTAVAAPAGPR